MATDYAEAVAALFQSPLDQFVAERKRLSAVLAAAGDKPGATRLRKLARPPLSAWAVNQLWWQARDGFEQLLSAAERLRTGELAAGAAHREALAKLRARAAALLVAGGHAVNDATLRRVTATLSAVAASGGFDPDPPGALVADRDPPGFDAAVMFQASRSTGALDAPEPRAHTAEPLEARNDLEVEATARRDAEAAARRRRDAEEAEERRRRDAEAAERLAQQRREEEELARRLAEKKRLESELQQTRARAEMQAREIERLREQLVRAEAELVRSRAVAEDLQGQLAGLDVNR